MAAANDPSASGAPQSSPPPATASAPPTESTGVQATPPSPGTTAIQATMPPDEAGRIPLPPGPQPRIRKPMSPESLARQARRLDWALVVVALALAFLLGSFAARKGALWMHLASGRLLAQGKYILGSDPFTYTCADSRWVNHAWLWDLSHYGLFTVAGGEDGQGGAALVIFKALLVTLLAGVLIATRRRDLGLWAPAGCATLAILVLSPYLILRPMVVSFLLLGLTLYLLQRPPAPNNSRAGRWFRGTNGRAWLLLPPLFALWANLDSWFFLGPLTVLLYLAGEVLQSFVTAGQSAEPPPQPRDLKTLACILLLGLAACLLNPYGLGVFTNLPPELTALTLSENLRNDVGFKIYRPFAELMELIQEGSNDFFKAGEAGNVAGWSYFGLLLLGLVSFVLNLEGWVWWRGLIWLSFAVLSGFQAGAIPFFAVVGGPISALNLQDFAVRRFGAVSFTEANWPLWLLGGRVLTLLVGVALLLLAWPGWLHTGTDQFDDPRAPHRVAWAVEPDPSLKAAAQKLAELRREGIIGANDRGFNFTPEIAAYWAWYCPEEKAFFDYRFQLSPETAKTFADVRRALLSAGRLADTTESPVDWQRIFKEHQVRYLVLSNRHEREAQDVALHLWTDPDESRRWAMVYNDGQTFIFGWNPEPDPSTQSPFQKSRLDVNELAFGKAAQPLEPRREPRPPQRGDWWDHYLKMLAPRPTGADEAHTYLKYYREIARQWAVERKGAQDRAWSRSMLWLATHLVGIAAGGQGSAELLLDNFEFWPRAINVIENRALQKELPARLASEPPGLGPPAAALLAVRAARRAINANPDDPDAYALLWEAYTMLLAQEDAWSPRRIVDRRQHLLEDTPRSQLRALQLATALQHLLTLQPDHVMAHSMLAGLYHQHNYLDMEVDQYREALKYLEERLPGLPEKDQAGAKRQVEVFNTILKNLEPKLKDKRDRYVNDAKNQPARVKFALAQNLGLTQEALNILEHIDATELKKDEAQYLTGSLLDLYLSTGQVDKARDIKTTSDWYLFRIAALDGNYAQAGKHLDAWLDQQQQQRLLGVSQILRQQAFGGSREGMSPASIRSLVGTVLSLRELAEVHTLSGMLALEEGDIQAAKRHFEESRKIGYPWKPILASAVTPLAGSSPLTLAVCAEAARQSLRLPNRFHYEAEPVALRYLQQLLAQEGTTHGQ
jgi:hypothetical protein